jgi:hypothetical protein
MRFAVLRVSGPDWDAEAFVREHGLTTAPFWRAAGLAADRTSSKSGFNLVITDPDSRSHATPSIGEWIRHKQSVLAAIRDVGAHAELHIGFGVEDGDPLLQTTFATTELALLAEYGVQLQLTAFVQTKKC